MSTETPAGPEYARLTDAERADLCICPLTTKLRPAMEGDTHVYGCSLYAKRVLAILLTRLPEATTVTEHGHDVNGFMTGPIDDWQGYMRGELRATHQRTVERFADRVGPWEKCQ